jgi:CSLREA domain-containing protein
MNKRFSLLMAVMAMGFAGLACAVIGYGDVITVTKTEDTNDGNCSRMDCSLREAVAEAIERAGKDKIAIPEGFYLLTLNSGSSGGQLIITENVLIEGEAQGLTIIDGNGETSSAGIFGIINNAGLEISDLMIQNVIAPGAAGGAFFNGGGELTIRNVVIHSMTAGTGGAIYNAGSLSLENVAITNNEALTGGGIYLSRNSEFSAVGSHFGGNRARGRAGAIFVSVGSHASVEDSQFASNQSDGQAGAIYNEAILSLRQSQLTKNQVQTGGAIYNGISAQLEMFDSNLQDNQAEGVGGGIFNSQGVVTVNRVSLIGNRARDGAGAWTSSNSVMTILSSTVSGNRDTNRGAGLMNSGGQLIIRFSTIFNNAPHSGIFALYGDTRLSNSIVAGNQGGNCSGELTSEGNNLKGDDTCGALAEGDVIQSDAALSGLSSDGNTFVHPLDADSPAIDAANNLNCPEEDQQLQGRPQDGNDDGELVCDIGAYELVALVTSQLQLPTSTSATIEAEDCTYTASVNLFCREGPGSSLYPDLDSFVPGQSAPVVGLTSDGNYFYVTGPNSGLTCTVPESSQFGEVSGECSDLPQFTPPPPPPTSTPTEESEEPTNTPTQESEATNTPAATGNITGLVWKDTNADGSHQGSEPGYANVNVRLGQGACGSTGLMNTSTSSNGTFSFSGLPAGTYCVSVSIAPACGDYTAAATPTQYTINLGAGEAAARQFGFQILVC